MSTPQRRAGGRRRGVTGQSWAIPTSGTFAPLRTRPTPRLLRPNVCMRGSATRSSVIVAVILCVAVTMLSLWSSSAAPSRRADERVSSRRRGAPPPSYQKLQVNLDVEERLRESPGRLSRDPFRFYVRPVTLTPHIEQVAYSPPTTLQPAPPAAPPVPPMTWKLMGIVQRDTRRWAVFADCRSIPVPIAKAGRSRASGG